MHTSPIIHRVAEPPNAPPPGTYTHTTTGTTVQWNGPPPPHTLTALPHAGLPQPPPPPPEFKTLTPPPTGDTNDGVMLALYPDPDTATALAVKGGAPADELHVTVAYLGKVDAISPAELIRIATGLIARAPITGEFSGHARFTGGDSDVLVALYDSAPLERLRCDTREALDAAGIELGSDHGYTPHLTLGYLAPTDTSPVTRLTAHPVTFTALAAVHGTTIATLPFLGDPAPPLDVAAAEYDPGPDTADYSGDPWLDVKGKPFPGAAPPFAKKKDTTGGKDAADSKDAAGGGDTPPAIATGSYVALGDRKGKVDLVVTTGTVPGATAADGTDVAATASSAAARVVEYEPAGNGTYKATGRKFAASVATLRRIPPLRTRETKSLEEGLAWTTLAHGDDDLGPPPPPAAALRTVYGRGTKAWPGEHRTTLTAHQWALSRVDAFAATAAGMRPAGYTADDDLLPGGEH